MFICSVKRILGLAMAVSLAAALLTGCGGSAPQGGSGNGTEPKTEAIKGETMETDHFTMTVATGYNKMDISGGIQAYQGSNAIEVWVRPSTQNAEEEAGKFAADYDGTAPEQVELFGLTFYTTTFTASGYDQTKYVAVSDGNRIEIGITGADHENNKELQGMLNSISFK